MRVGYNGMLLYGAYSGVETVIEELLVELSHRNMDLVSCLPRKSETIQKVTPKTIIKEVELKLFHKVKRILWEQFQINKWALEMNVDLLHCPGYICPNINKSIPVVLTVHDLFSISHPKSCSWKNRLYYNLMLEKSLLRANAIAVSTTYVKQQIEEHFPKVSYKVSVIPFAAKTVTKERGLNFEHYRKEYGIVEPYFIFLGNFEPKKNIEMILESFKNCKDRLNDDSQLLLVGSKNWGEAIDSKLQQHPYQKDILVLKNQSDLHCRMLLENAKALLFLSHREGFGLPALESLQLKTPVIATKSAVPFASIDSGILFVENGDVDKVVDYMLDCINNTKEVQSTVEKGATFSKKFSWEKTVDQYLELYSQVISK